MKAPSSDPIEQRYDDDHRHPVNRALHRVGVPIIALSVPTLLVSRTWGLSLLALGYGINFAGHAVEGSVPTLFRSPRGIVLGARHFGGELVFRALGRPLATDSIEPS